MRQRIRWAKGHLQAFVETGPKLFKHIFVTGGAANRADVNAGGVPKSKWKRFVNNIRLRFMSFDMLTVVYPRSLVFTFKKSFIFIIRALMVLFAGRNISVYYGPKFMHALFGLFGVPFTFSEPWQMVLLLAGCGLAWDIYSYGQSILTAIYVYIIEHKRIMHIKWYKKIWFCLTFPIFDLIGKISMIIALFTKVEWKPIPHNASVSISEYNKMKNKTPSKK